VGRLVDEITHWIRERVKEAGAEGVVVGLSGGLDSSVVAALSKKAMEEKALGLIMPCESKSIDEEYAQLIASHLNIKTERVVLDGIYHKFREVLPHGNRLALANLKPRLRMITLYYFANNLNYLVAGTGNKSELMVGYFTKYGDGGVDILPIGGLLKSEVKKLAEELGIPQEIINRIPTAGLWEDQTDEGELGITYKELDEVLRRLEIGDVAGLKRELVDKVKGLIEASQHKRSPAKIFSPQN
jgi:NAD+ synthase